MRFFNRSWVLLIAAALSGATVAACSADAGSGTGTDDSGTEGSTTDGSVDGSSLDSTSPDGGHNDATTPDASTQDTSTADTASDTATPDTSTDTGSSDTGTTDANEAGPDAAPDSGDAGMAPVGSPCSPPNAIETRPCGLCGQQARVCLSPDGGQAVWQAWGFCMNQVVGGCTPGSMTSQACGLCGTQQRVCQNDCTYAVGACTGQPMNACMPGTVDYQSGLSCDAGGRERTCGTNCTFGNFGQCLVADGGGGPLALDIPRTVASASTSKVVTVASPGIDRLDPISSSNGSCVVDTTVTIDTYLEIHNPTSQSATVSVWLSPASGSVAWDTLAAIYPGSTIPPSSRLTCSDFNDDCSTAPCVGGLLSGFIGTSRPVIPAGGSVVIYIGAYSSSQTQRDVTVNARTDLLQ